MKHFGNLLSSCLLLASLCLSACVDKSGEDRSNTAASNAGSQPAADSQANPCDSEPADSGTIADAGEQTDAAAEGMDESNPCEMSHEGEVRRMRGVITANGTGFFFTPCGLSEMSINDDAANSLRTAAPDLVGPDGQFYAIMDASMGEATMTLERLWHAAPIGETSGCEEDLSNVVYRAAGNEPFWGITVFSNGLLSLTTPEGQWNFSVSEMTADENFVNISGVPMGEGAEIAIEFASASCQDSMSGAYSSMIATVIHGEQQLGGCAWVGEAIGITEGE